MTAQRIGSVQLLRTRIYTIDPEQDVGDGLFAINAGDEATEDEVRFPSKRFGPDEFAELLADPVCVVGPEQRIVFHLDGQL